MLDAPILDTGNAYVNPLLAAALAAARAACADRTPENVAAQAAIVNPIRVAYLTLVDVLRTRERSHQKALAKASYTLRSTLNGEDTQDITDARNTFNAVQNDYYTARKTRDAYAALHYVAHCALIAVICNTPELIAIADYTPAMLDADLPVPTTADLTIAAVNPKETVAAFVARHNLKEILL